MVAIAVRRVCATRVESVIGSPRIEWTSTIKYKSYSEDIDSLGIGRGRVWRKPLAGRLGAAQPRGIPLPQAVPRQAVVEDLQVGMILEVAGLMPRLEVE
jgi:hypothetical protein